MTANNPATIYAPTKPCTWTEKDEGDYWQAGCNPKAGGAFTFNEDNRPSAHNFKFCPFCGHQLVELPIALQPVDEE